MARTKKYLVASKTARSRQGFYRPIRRVRPLAETSSHPVNSRSPRYTPEPEELEDDHEDLPILKSKRRPVLIEEDEDDIPESNYRSPKKNRREPEPEDLDTHSYDDELQKKLSLLEKELHYSVRKRSELENELDDIKSMLTSEHKKIQKTIHNLQDDVEHTDNFEEHKFLKLSQELKEVATAMNQLLADEPKHDATLAANASAAPATPTAATPAIGLPPTTPALPTTPAPADAPVAVPPVTPTPTAAPSPTPTLPTPAPVPTTETPPPVVSAPATKGFKIKIPKGILVLGVSVLIVATIGGVGWYFLNRKTEVDQALLQEYLPKDAQTKTPAQQEEKKIDPNPTTASSSASPAAQETKGASSDRFAEAQADIPFDQTKWETLKVTPLFFNIDFPQNSVSVIKTDASVTFLRKTGYIFKVQVVETALEVEEYWKLIKASSLDYKVKESTFKGEKALFLELEDFTDYPGDKYLVKYKDYIYDIWYATYNQNLSNDDAKRIDIMLNSFKFTE